MRLLDFLVSVFVAPDAPIRLAVDDTLFGRSGRRVWGAHYLHDGAQPEGSGQRTRWGNCWVVVVLVVNLDCLDGRPVGLPILFRLFRPKDDEHPDRPSQPVLARTLIDVVLGVLVRTVHQPQTGRPSGRFGGQAESGSRLLMSRRTSP